MGIKKKKSKQNRRIQDGREYLWPVTSDLSVISCFFNQRETEVKKTVSQGSKISQKSNRLQKYKHFFSKRSTEIVW